MNNRYVYIDKDDKLHIIDQMNKEFCITYCESPIYNFVNFYYSGRTSVIVSYDVLWRPLTIYDNIECIIKRYFDLPFITSETEKLCNQLQSKYKFKHIISKLCHQNFYEFFSIKYIIKINDIASLISEFIVTLYMYEFY